MFGMRILEEDGSVVEQKVADEKFNPVRMGFQAEEFPIMGTLDPCGDTSLNYLQCGLLIREIEKSSDSLVERGVKKEFLSDLIRMCRVAHAKPHRRLLFIGD